MNWFHLSEDESLPDYSLARLVDATVESFGQNYRDYTVRVSQDNLGNEGVELRGATMRPLFTVLYTLIENGQKHGLESNRECKVEITRTGGAIRLRVSNPISKDAVESLHSLRVSELVRRVNQPSNLGAVRIEGDSGYVKLGKLVRYDLGIVNSEFDISIDTELAVYTALLVLPEGSIRAHPDH